MKWLPGGIEILLWRFFSVLGSKDIAQYDDQLSRPYNMSYVDLTSNSVKLLFFFNESNIDPRRQIQKLEVCELIRLSHGFQYSVFVAVL